MPMPAATSGMVGAQERVGLLLLADADGDGRQAALDFAFCFRLALRQRLVVRLDGAGEFDVGEVYSCPQ